MATIAITSSAVFTGAMPNPPYMFSIDPVYFPAFIDNNSHPQIEQPALYLQFIQRHMKLSGFSGIGCPYHRRNTHWAILFFLMLLTPFAFGQTRPAGNKKTFADHFRFISIAVEEKGYHIWGTSPIRGDDGKIHLFVARWPVEATFDPGWRTHSEIAHYVGDKPEGPFRFDKVVVRGTGTGTWDKNSAHNPQIKKFGDTYALLYISNNQEPDANNTATQRIGMLISKSPYGPWTKAGTDGMILQPSGDSSHWTYHSRSGVTNPSLMRHKNGKFYLYFKSAGAKMGVAIADSLEGPYTLYDQPVTKSNRTIEDGYAFYYKGKIALLTTDNHGIIEKGGGILWLSDDGLNFNDHERGFYTIQDYTTFDPAKMKEYYVKGIPPKFERPQLLFNRKGKPAYLYVPSGTNIFGGGGTASYVLKFK